MKRVKQTSPADPGPGRAIRIRVRHFRALEKLAASQDIPTSLALTRFLDDNKLCDPEG